MLWFGCDKNEFPQYAVLGGNFNKSFLMSQPDFQHLLYFLLRIGGMLQVLCYCCALNRFRELRNRLCIG
ncbi:Uncharacterised protein [Sphingobacterium spiritivorum]|uniref:Uncharacterized protein n=1 Tax=Sphingobacterium spiritivorum ATCC 33861 TaxID=525373 RepID=D7VR71_SPHSI|nr:hypothetical protein HMPREF0766_13475 [Sphingobacterium spiritivorum ATCC 33861]SUJ08392.1 Uncharacterised protein [Sphingobacterium spiritivorum]